jgi:hypothetical protein
MNFFCKECNTEVPHSSINYHLKSKHKMSKGDYDEKYEGLIQLVCDICGKKAGSKILMSLHKKKEHGIISEHEEKLSRQEKGKEISNVICKVCREKFHSKKTLSRHLKKVHGMLAIDYYKKFEMKETDHEFCKECGVPNGFRFDRGFNDFCSFSCSTTWYAKNTDRTAKSWETIKRKQKEDPNFCLIPSQLQYWLNKGFSIEDAQRKQSERQTTFSKEKLVAKHGEEVGLELWKNRQEKWQKNYKKSNFSKISQKLFWEIYGKINLKECYFAQNRNGIKDESGTNNEYLIETEDSFCKLDFFIPLINYCIEFDGDYWHGERRGNQERDTLREKNILLFNPLLTIIHVKEREYKNNSDKIVTDIVTDIDNRLKNIYASTT